MKLLFQCAFISCVLLSLVSSESSTPLTNMKTRCSIKTAEDGSKTDTCPSLYTCSSGTCVHKPLFPLENIEIIGLVITIIITGLASSGGNGGGTVLTPILLIFFRYSESNAIMIVYSLIFGGAIGNFVNTGRKKNPKTGKPYLNYDLCLLCMPPMLLGTSAGIIMNRVVAPAVVIVGLTALTTYTLYRVTKKARSEYAKETIHRRRDLKLLAEEGLLNNGFSDSTDTDGPHTELLQVISQENRLFPPLKVLKILGLLGAMVLLELLRGTENFRSIIGIGYCGVEYWVLFGVGLVICLGSFLINYSSVKTTLKLKEKHRYSFPRSDEYELKTDHIAKLLVLSLLAGVLAGMFGIGGGTIMSPTLLGLGIKAQALSATSGLFVLQTSFMSLISAVLYKEVPLSVLGFFLGVSCLGSFGVSYILNKLVKRYQRPSIILISLLLVFWLSLFATPIYEVVTNIDDLSALLIFNPVC